jgi:serine/threonine protein kinase
LSKTAFQNRPQVQVLGVCVDEQPFKMVLEYLENGDLRSYLHKTPRENLKFEKLLLICEDVSPFVC